MEYTKRKWKIYKGSENVSERVPPEGRSVLWNIWVVDDKEQAIAQVHSNDDAKLKANAYLIAAAPAMEKALRAVLNSSVCDICYEDNCGGEFSCTKGVDGEPCECHQIISEAESSGYKALSLAEGKGE